MEGAKFQSFMILRCILGAGLASMRESKRVCLVLATLGFACWCAGMLGLARLPGRGWDFRVFYTGASLPFQDLYKLHEQGVFQNELMKPWGTYVPSWFARPPFYALLLKPLALLGFTTALHLWLAVLCAAAFGCVLLLRAMYGAGLGVFVFLVSYYPVSLSLRLGQDSSLVLAALLLALRFHRLGRDWLAALALTFAFQKFNLLFLIPLALLLHGKRSLLLKLVGCLAASAAAGALLVGRSGILDYAALVSGDRMDTMFLDAWNLRATVWRWGGGRTIFLACVSVVVVWFIWLGSRIEFELAWWLSVLFGLVVTWHSYAYDYTLALPLLCLLWADARASIAGIWLAGGLWIHFLVGEAMSWMVAPLALLLSLEIYWRERRRRRRRITLS